MTPTASKPDHARLELEESMRRRHLLTTISLTAFSLIAYAVTVLRTAARLPETMATHFDVAGRADSFMPTAAALLFQGAVVLAVPVALLATFWLASWWRGEYARSLSAMVSGTSVALTTMFTLLTAAHVDVADPTGVQLTWRMGLVILGAGVGAGLVVLFSLPMPLPALEPRPVVPVEIAPSYRVSWFGKARMGQAFVVIMVASVALLVVATLASGIWWMWLMAALLILMIAALSSFDVIVDARGVRWRGALGLPRGSARLADITGVSVVDVGPGDFGGYGLRVLPGRTGIITRSGRALRVLQGNKVLAITVDDPEIAAGVLEGLRMKGRSR